jgi:hypothetical protein
MIKDKNILSVPHGVIQPLALQAKGRYTEVATATKDAL